MKELVYSHTSRVRGIVFDLLLITAALLLALATLQLTGCSTTPEKHVSEPIAKVEPADMGANWGIEITSIQMTANGYMIDFRYRVLNAEKAAPLFVRHNKPYLIDQASGKVLAVPVTAKVGPLRTSDNPQEGRIYWMFFGNTRGLVKAGSQVTVVIGEFKAENLVVQ